jgi:hypothetical protein
MALDLLRRHDLGVEYARQLAAAVPDHQVLLESEGFTAYWLLSLLQAGEPEQAWDVLRQVKPIGIARGEAILAGDEIDEAHPDQGHIVSYVWLLLQTGQEDKARALLQRVVAFWDEKCADTTTAQRRSAAFGGCRGLYLMHGSLGQREATLAAMRQTYIEDGWSYRNWFSEDHGALNFLQDDPEYLEIIQAVEDRLAVQRARIREMERNGELPMAQWEIDARAALAAQKASEAPDG